MDARVVVEACQGAAELQMYPSVDHTDGTRNARTSLGLASVENIMIYSSLAGTLGFSVLEYALFLSLRFLLGSCAQRREKQVRMIE